MFTTTSPPEYDSQQNNDIAIEHPKMEDQLKNIHLSQFDRQ